MSEIISDKLYLEKNKIFISGIIIDDTLSDWEKNIFSLTNLYKIKETKA